MARAEFARLRTIPPHEIERRKMGFNEMFRGQRRVTPDRELEPRYTGKTIFTSGAPVPPVQRIAAILFCLGFIALCFFFIERSIRFGEGALDLVWRSFLALLMSFCIIVALMALLGIRPFNSKRIESGK